ncbi:MAG: hypothetical protein AMXMBFR33_06390 [Candidatus Xenobia bacterium]
MHLTALTPSYPTRASAPVAPPPAAEPEYGSDIPGYTGPKDGRSHPKYGTVLRPIVKALASGRYRVQIEGKENLPGKFEGPYVYSPTHPSAFDPIVFCAAMDRPLRLMGNQYLFRGPAGPLLTWMGLFPVDREGANPVTLKHCNEVLKEGHNLVIFPEGGLVGAEHRDTVAPIKKGAAASAIVGGAKAIIPIAIHYEEDRQKRPGEAILGALTAAGVTTAGLLSSQAGPLLQGLGGVLVGGATGAYLLGKVAERLAPDSPETHQGPRYLASIAGGAVGLLVGGVAGFLFPQANAVLSVTAGLATLMAANALRRRPLARIAVQPQLDANPYRARSDQKQAIVDLTVELHRSLGKGKQALTGHVYDDSAPKFKPKIVETYKGGISW